MNSISLQLNIQVPCDVPVQISVSLGQPQLVQPEPKITWPRAFQRLRELNAEISDPIPESVQKTEPKEPKVNWPKQGF